MNRTSVLLPHERLYAVSTLVKCQCELFPNCKCFYVNTTGNFKNPIRADRDSNVSHNYQVTRSCDINLNILYVEAKWKSRRMRVASFFRNGPKSATGPDWKMRLIPAIPGLFFKDLFYYQHRGYRFS